MSRRSRRPKRSQARVPTLRQPTVPIRLRPRRPRQRAKAKSREPPRRGRRRSTSRSSSAAEQKVRGVANLPRGPIGCFIIAPALLEEARHASPLLRAPISSAFGDQPASGAKKTQKDRINERPNATLQRRKRANSCARKRSANRLFAIVSKLFTLGILDWGRFGDRGVRGASGHTLHFWLPLRCSDAAVPFSGFAPKCAPPTIPGRLTQGWGP